MAVTLEDVAYLNSFFVARGASISGATLLSNSVPRLALSFDVPTVASVEAAQAAANAAQATANSALASAGGAGSGVAVLQATVASLQVQIDSLSASLVLAEARIQALEDELAAAYDGSQVVVENVVGPITKTITVANGLITGIV